ncbi:PAS domain-containing protein [Marinilabilia rubra]|uniref:histidine kinase n=1 Tax=Marinilabilia rubra TaxID=2162893 RepID=A0A2U2B4S9_9BACT|nr:PAS domain S-box protein [Marinilabilia rubra]PWD98047.1 PAS domain-containing sensor histidine kinase [Marinilabilia rubra]
METAVNEEVDYSKMFKHLPVGVVFQNINGEIITANKSAEKILGIPLERIKGRDLLSPKWHAINEKGVPLSHKDNPAYIAFRTGKPVKGFTMGFIHPYLENYKWISVDSVPLFRNNEEKPYQVFSTIADVTDKIKARYKLHNSETRYKTLMDNLQTSVLIIQDGIIRFANNALSEKSGYSNEELIGKDFKNFLHPEEEALINKYYHQRFNGGNPPDSYRIKAQKKTGQYIWMNVKVRVIEYEGKSSLLVLMDDIHAQVEFEEQLKKSEANFRNLFERAPVGIALVDFEGHPVVVNDRLCNILGYTREEFMKMHFGEFSHPDDLQKDKDFFAQIKAGKRDSYKMEKRYIHKSGKIICSELKVSVLRNSKSNQELVIGMVTDRTEQKLAAEELLITKEKAEESNRLKSAFLATISHEIRTPLNSILGFSDIIQNTSEDPETLEYSSIIYENGHNLLTIMDDILELALAENGKVSIRPESFNLKELFSQFCGHLSEIIYKAGKDNIEMQCYFDPGLEGENIVLDKSKTFQVIMNLMKNAVKFTHEGFIELGCYRKSPNTVSFYVKDTGIGIDEKTLAIIFEFFRQGDDSQTRKYGGIGVGLAISKRIAKAMKGDLTVESTPGEGSVFKFTIPI